MQEQLCEAVEAPASASAFSFHRLCLLVEERFVRLAQETRTAKAFLGFIVGGGGGFSSEPARATSRRPWSSSPRPKALRPGLQEPESELSTLGVFLEALLQGAYEKLQEDRALCTGYSYDLLRMLL